MDWFDFSLIQSNIMFSYSNYLIILSFLHSYYNVIIVFIKA